jgi:hypothetical protein
MSDREPVPPRWGPAVDPLPWGPDPIPFPWYQWWRRIPFPQGDPIPFPIAVLEKIRVEDVIALRQAGLDAAEELFKAQMKAARAFAAKQLEILSKYK